jgi:hypothetical protein
VGLLDRLLGRTAPPPPRLDALFAVPNAAVTLDTALGMRPLGTGSVCFRAAEGGQFSDVETDIRRLLDVDGGPQVERSTDAYGFTWLTSRHSPDDVAGLVTDLYAVASTLQEAGYGPALLCTLVGFADTAGRRLALVYLSKRGTYYPFAPLDGEGRDNGLELQVRGALAPELSVEPDLSRWFPVWGAPGL